MARRDTRPDPSGLFNSSLEGKTRRAIDFHQGDKIDEKAGDNSLKLVFANLTRGETWKSEEIRLLE